MTVLTTRIAGEDTHNAPVFHVREFLGSLFEVVVLLKYAMMAIVYGLFRYSHGWKVSEYECNLN